MFPLIDFLQGELALTLAALVALVLLAVRALASERALRRDLKGALLLLLGYLVLRGVEHLSKGQLTPSLARLLHVTGMLAFAFALIRTAVSGALFLVRANGTPVPKILRDVVDGSCLLLVAIPIVKSEYPFDLSGLLAGSAIASVVLGLALQETLGNLFAGLSIQIERPFQVGDYVQVQQTEGVVSQVAWRATRIETARHEVVTIPNNVLSKEPVKNFSRAGQPVAIELHFGASYDCPPNRVKQVVLEMLAEIPLVLESPAPQCVTYEYRDSAVDYRIRCYLATYAHAGAARDDIYSRLWYRLRRAGIGQPYPQTTVHMAQPTTADFWPVSTRLELLRTVDLFSVLQPEELLELATEVRPRHFGRGERVIQEGEAGQSFYVVGAGEVAVQTATGTVVTRLGPGQHFGEMSLLTGEPRSATVSAATDAVLFEVERPTLARLFSQNPGLARQLSARLAERRTQLRVAAQAQGPGDSSPEAGRILGRLRQIFGLKLD